MRRAGKTGLQISRLGLGTMTWGRDTDTHEAAEQMRCYIEAGGNFIDTASTYADGDAERVIGGLIGTFFEREEVVIATKAGISFPDGQRTVDNSRHHLIAELDRSLTRLGTDYVDLWQVHTWDENVPLEDTLSALDYAYSSGKARYVGVSNFNGWQSARAITVQESNSAKAPITTLQNEYSLLNRSIENEIIDCAHSLDVGILAWSPLGRGVLTGKYRASIPADSRGATPGTRMFRWKIRCQLLTMPIHLGKRAMSEYQTSMVGSQLARLLCRNQTQQKRPLQLFRMSIRSSIVVLKMRLLIALTLST